MRLFNFTGIVHFEFTIAAETRFAAVAKMDSLNAAFVARKAAALDLSDVKLVDVCEMVPGPEGQPHLVVKEANDER